MAASLAAEEDLEAEVVLSSHSGSQNDVVVPLEPGSENRQPPMLTPSEQVGQTAGTSLPVGEAVKEAVGESAFPMHWTAARLLASAPQADVRIHSIANLVYQMLPKGRYDRSPLSIRVFIWHSRILDMPGSRLCTLC